MAGSNFSITAIIGVNSSRMAKGLKSAAAKMTLWAKATMAKVGTLIKGGMLVATAAFGAAATSGIRQFASFEQGMNEVFTLMPGMSKKAMSKMSDQVLDLSKKMGVVPEEIVPSLYSALSAGVPAGGVFDFLEVSIKGAKAGVATTAESVDALSSVVNAYGADTIDAARASDIIFTTIKKGKTTFPELASSLYNVAPAAAAAGVSFDQVGSAIAALTAAGVPTSVATTQIRAAILSMMAPNKAMQDNFQALGMDATSLGEVMKGPGGLKTAMEMVIKASGGNKTALKKMFGSVEALQASLVVTKDSAKMFSGVLDEMGVSAGATDTAFGQMDQGVSRSFENLIARFKVALITMGEAFAPVIEKLMPTLFKVIDAFEKLPWAKLINGLSSVWNIGLKPTFKNIIDAIRSLPWQHLIDFLLPIASLVIKTIQKIGSIIVSLSPLIIPLIEVITGYFVVVYGKIVILINFLEKVAGKIGAVFKSMLEIISAAMSFLISPSAKKFEWLKNEVTKKFKELGANLGSAFRGIWAAIKEKFGGMAGSLSSIFRGLLGSLWGNLKNFISNIPGLSDAIEEIAVIFAGIRAEIGGEIAALVDAWGSMFGAVQSNVKGTSMFQKVINYLASSFGEILVKLVKFVGNLMKLYAMVIKIGIRIMTQLAPAIKDALPVALKVAGAAVYFLIEGIKATISIINFLIKMILKLEPSFMTIVNVVTGFVAAISQGLKAIFGMFAFLYMGIRNGMAAVAVFFVEAFYKIKGTVMGVINFIMGLFKALKDFVYWVLFGGTITKDFQKAFQFIWKVVQSVLNAIFKVFDKFKAIVKTILTGIAGIFQTVFAGILKVFDKFGEVVGNVLRGIMKMFQTVFGGIRQIANDVLSGIAGVFKTIFDGIGSVVKTLGDVVKSVFSTIGNQITKILSSFTNMANVIKGIFGKVMELGGKALDLAGGLVKGAGGALSGITSKLGFGGGKGVSKKMSTQVSASAMQRNLKPILAKLTSMDNSLKSIDRALKGKFVNQ